MDERIPSIELNTVICEPCDSHTDVSSVFGSADMVEITAVISGGGIHKIMNESMECHAGDLYIFGGGVPHSYCAVNGEEPLTVMRISFNVSETLCGAVADKTSSEYCYGIFRDRSPVSYAMLNANAMSGLKQAYADMEVELTEKSPCWQEAVCSHLKLLLIFLGRYINQAVTAFEEKPKEWITVSTAIAEINEHFGESDFNLETVAASLFISRSRLSRIFHKVTGEAFPDYVRGVRLRHACELLKNTELTNEEIVGRCGLKDVPTFYRVFKSGMGMTPGSYRALQKPEMAQAMEGILDRIADGVKRGKKQLVIECMEKALSLGLSPAEILKNGLICGMNSIGERFKKNEVYVPEVLVAARAMNAAIAYLKPMISEGDIPNVGKVCIGTVQGDLHDIGKNLVKMMLESKGLEVIDLGVDVSAERFVDAAIEHGCRVICCSALLTTTMHVLAEVVNIAEERGIRSKVKILVGGAPVSAEYAAAIRADGYTDDAAAAADAAYEICVNYDSENT